MRIPAKVQMMINHAIEELPESCGLIVARVESTVGVFQGWLGGGMDDITKLMENPLKAGILLAVAKHQDERFLWILLFTG
jgi:hypothetical protein